jgi:hypothetical protein
MKGSLFVVLHSRNQVEFVKTYAEAKSLKGKYKDGLCKKISQTEVGYWQERVKAIPKLQSNASIIHTYSCYYSDQDHDISATIGVAWKDFSLAEPTLADGSHGCALASIVRALEVAPPHVHLTIYTESLFFLFAVHYGFRNYPKLQPEVNFPFRYLWSRLEQLISEREVDGSIVCFDFIQSKNLACGPASGIVREYENDCILWEVSSFDLFYTDQPRNLLNN